MAQDYNPCPVTGFDCISCDNGRCRLADKHAPASGSSKWGPSFPPARCTAWEDCHHDGICHDPNCGAPSQHDDDDHTPGRAG